jgi:hypothetical protein
MFRVGLLLIIRRYSSVYTAVGIFHVFMLTGCWQDRKMSWKDIFRKESTRRHSKTFSSLPFSAACIHPPSTYSPPPLSFKQTLLHESVATSWTAFTKFRPTFLVTWRRGGRLYGWELLSTCRKNISCGWVGRSVCDLLGFVVRFSLRIFIWYVYVFYWKKLCKEWDSLALQG